MVGEDIFSISKKDHEKLKKNNFCPDQIFQDLMKLIIKIYEDFTSLNSTVSFLILTFPNPHEKLMDCLFFVTLFFLQNKINKSRIYVKLLLLNI